MLGYYSLSRRRSAQKNDPPSPGLPLYSSSINESELPTSPKALKLSASPTSPVAENRITEDGLGSPFSITGPAYPLQSDSNNRPKSKNSLPTLSEHERTENMLHSGGSKVPLISKDFGMKESPKNVNMQEENTKESITSDSFSLLPGDDNSLPKSAIDLPSQGDKESARKISNIFDDPKLLPPPSIHDQYVSKHIKPIAPPDLSSPTLESRPSLNRSTSAPGHPNHSATSPPNQTGLLPSAIPSETSENQKNDDANQPIYEIFNANLSTDGLEMSKKLRGYLDLVLKGQEQVGRMHLSLEGLGMGSRGIWEVGKDNENDKNEEDVKGKIEERQKGIEDIMQRLGEISDTLRNYHQLGTPKLTFPRRNTKPQSPLSAENANRIPRTPNANALGRSTTIAGGTTSPELSKNNRTRAPTLVRSNTAVGDLSPNSIKQQKEKARSPLINTFTQFTSSDDDITVNKKNTDLPPLPLPHDQVNFPTSPPYTGGRKIPFLDMDRIHDQHPRAEDAEGETPTSHHHWFGESPDSKTGKRERKITDSPIEMTFKSRF
ncbi:uncharacterized protein I206_103600 [Kwoniella pini CBS 10737]|uniref:Uncharacterized protein n=1 Tax=Kwoniella pini CBS 10737 TaxID=1296096 RepID=A0A1B9I931_9TREE|nr:uncharacterized protein I206_01397 [Kwoniella pini CBS 10737]OCF52112.1 hypothetical protein I206_01397 [Kwoniella pini CBS 10737]